MWKIFQEEIRKIASRKIIWWGLALVLIFVTFRLGIVKKEYTSAIDGQTYVGKEAIQKDQELAREYAGPMTEETVRSIYDRFGFYYYNEQGEKCGRNFWNEYITDHMTNFMQIEGDDPAEIQFYEGEEWERNVAPLLNGDLRFDYNYGWEDLRETLILVNILLSIIFIVGMAPVFSEEYTLRTANILLTTRRGKKSAVWLKTAAALTFTAAAYYAVSLYLWLLYRYMFGTQGLDASPRFLNAIPAFGYTPKTVQGFFWLEFGLGAAAMILLSALVLVVSAAFRSAFMSVVISAGVFISPYIWMKVISPMLPLGSGFTRTVNHLMVSMPFYLHGNWGFAFSAGQIRLHIVIAAVVTAVCVVLGYRKYRNYQG